MLSKSASARVIRLFGWEDLIDNKAWRRRKMERGEEGRGKSDQLLNYTGTLVSCITRVVYDRNPAPVQPLLCVNNVNCAQPDGPNQSPVG